MVLPAAAAAVGVVGDDGMGDGMQCSEHPQYYNQRANPGGICALCLQEKLGRLVSSSPSNKSSSTHLFYPSALAAPPYSSDSPSSPPYSSLRPTVVDVARAGGDGRGSNSSAYASTGGHRRASSGSRAGTGGRSSVIPFLYATHGKKKKASGSNGSSTTTNRTSSAVSRKAISSTTSSSSLSGAISTTASSSSASSGGNTVFKRSKSVVPRPTGGYPDGCRAGGAITEDPEKFDSPRKKSFWSFLHLSSSQQHNHHHSHSSSSPRSTTAAAARRRGAGGGGGSKDENGSSTATSSVAATTYIRDIKLLPQPPQLPAISTSPVNASASRSNNKAQEDNKTPRREYPPAAVAAAAAGASAAATTVVRAEEADDSPGSGSQASTSFGRKVARSRSVGCGSRSFSGDFLERISTVGFGDCTLRRVESQREGKPGKVASHHHHQPASGEEDQELPPQRVVRCGGIFGGFYSSSYWLSDDLGGGNAGTGAGRISTAASGDGSGDGGTPHSRRSWAWVAFASPMRAFRPSSNKHASAVASVNGAAVTGVAARSALSSTTTASAAATATANTGGAAILAVKG